MGGRWVPRLVALMLGGVLGMAVGHGLAWRTIAPLPDDDRARQIAAQFVPDLAGQVDRQDNRRFSPPGPVRMLTGFSDVQTAQVEVRFPVGSTAVERPQLEAVGEQLRASGWERVWVDPDYPGVTGHYQGLDVRFGAVLCEPPPSAGPDEPPAEQEIIGLAVTIRQDTPAAALLGLLFGALTGAALGPAVVVGVQRLLRGSDRSVRIAVVALSAVGAAGLVPGTLASIFGVYLLAVEDLPHEPLWFAYSLMAPPTRPSAAAGLLLLVVAVAVATADRVRRLAHRRSPAPYRP